ncbi:MAG: uridine kinase [Cyclobacteriaceae bacterium]
MKKEPYVVGICGGSGSGKTKVLNWIQKKFDTQEICLLSQDNYYRNRTTSTPEENRFFNFDEPEVIESDKFAQDLRTLKKGESIRRKEYTFNNPSKDEKMLEFHPAPIIVVEGIFVFHFPEVNTQLDLKVFVDVKEHVKFHRRITRDSRERGYPLEDILYKYTHHVAPAYEKYIEPYRHKADLVIPNNQTYQENECPPAVQVLVAFLKSKLAE